MVWRLEETWLVTNLTWSLTRGRADVMEGVDIRLGETVTTGECESLPNDTRWRKSALATSVEDVIDDIMTEIKTM